MKKIILTLILTFSLSNLYAFSLDDALEKLENNAKSDLKSGKISLNNVTDGFKDEIEEKVKEIEDRVKGKIDAAIGDVTSKIKALENIKSRIENYIFYAKIAASILSFSLLLILFLIWRAFRKLKGLYKMLNNVRNYKEIEARVEALEQAEAKEPAAS